MNEFPDIDFSDTDVDPSDLATEINVPTDWQMYSPEIMADDPDWDGTDHDAIVTEAVRAIAAKVGTEIIRPTQLLAAVLNLYDHGGMPPEIADTEPRWDLERWMVHVCRVMEWDPTHVRGVL